jgi:hypothetical protein
MRQMVYCVVQGTSKRIQVQAKYLSILCQEITRHKPNLLYRWLQNNNYKNYLKISFVHVCIM